jgi:hypothetical protein
MSARATKQTLRDYCNWTTDLAELARVSKTSCAEDKVFCNDVKRQLHEHMQTHHIDCFYDTVSGKFLYRTSRSSPKALSEEMQLLVLEEIGKAETEGKLKFVDIKTLVLDVIRLIQQVRTNKTESIKIDVKKPASASDAVTPTVKEVVTMLSAYIATDDKLSKLDSFGKDVKKNLTEKLKDVKPLVEDYCKTHSIIKKPMDFRRRISSEFTTCVTKFEPDYFNKVKSQHARRFLQYKQSKSRNCKVVTLRPSKKHMTEVLEQLTTQQTAGWTHVKLVQTLFKKLHEEAEENIVKKLEENETNPVFKLSLLGVATEDDDE